MKAYSQDLRKKIVEVVERGIFKTMAARTFGVSRSSVKRSTGAAREGKPLAPKQNPGSKPKLDGRARRLLETDVEHRPAVPVRERCRFLERVVGVLVSESTLSRLLRRMGFTQRSLAASERDEFLRAAWRLLFAGRVEAERLVFVDEMGANASLSPLYAWSRRGLRAHAKAPRNWSKNVTLLASITGEGIGSCLALEGPTRREVFEAYLERVLADATARADPRARQPLSPQGREGEGAHRGHGRRDVVSTAILAGSQMG